MMLSARTFLKLTESKTKSTASTSDYWPDLCILKQSISQSTLFILVFLFHCSLHLFTDMLSPLTDSSWPQSDAAFWVTKTKHASSEPAVRLQATEPPLDPVLLQADNYTLRCHNCIQNAARNAKKDLLDLPGKGCVRFVWNNPNQHDWGETEIR